MATLSLTLMFVWQEKAELGDDLMAATRGGISGHKVHKDAIVAHLQSKHNSDFKCRSTSLFLREKYLSYAVNRCCGADPCWGGSELLT